MTEWKFPLEVPRAEEGILRFRSVGVWAEVEGQEETVVVYYYFNGAYWLLAGTQVIAHVIRWRYKDENIPKNLSPLYQEAKKREKKFNSRLEIE